jgi:hypothetical protein
MRGFISCKLLIYMDSVREGFEPSDRLQKVQGCPLLYRFEASDCFESSLNMTEQCQML